MNKKTTRRVIRRFWGKPFSKDEIEWVLINLLQIKPGDVVLSFISYGNLKAGFPPSFVFQKIIELVGPTGNLLMPFYPGQSKDWISFNKVFDPNIIKTQSGAVSKAFKDFPEVLVSCHPLKALLAYGPNAEELIKEHHLSITPYDEKSPYAKLLNYKSSKVIGIGTSKNAFYHSCEDTIQGFPKYYSDKIYSLKCKSNTGQIITVNTKIHDSERFEWPDPREVLVNSKCKGFSEYWKRGRYFYVADAKSMHEHLQNLSNPHKHTFKRHQVVKKFIHKLTRL